MLRSLLFGPTRLERLQMRVDALQLFGVRLEGNLDASIQNLRLGQELGFQAAALELGKSSLTTGSLELALPKGASLVAITEAGSAAVKSTVRAGEVSVILSGKLAGTAQTLVATVRSPSRSGDGLASIDISLDALGWPALSLTLSGPLSGNLELLGGDARMRQLLLRGDFDAPLLIKDEPLKTKLQLQDLSLASTEISLRGHATAQGPNAQLLLELLRLPESLAFAFSGLAGTPFKLAGRIDYHSDQLEVSELDLVAGDSSATGRVSVGPTARKGALVLDYRGVHMGTRFTDQQGSFVFNPPSGWLDGADD